MSEHLQFRKTDEQEFFEKKNEGVGGHSGKFRKVPWYFFVIPFVKEVGGWLFSEISKSQHMFHQVFK